MHLTHNNKNTRLVLCSHKGPPQHFNLFTKVAGRVARIHEHPKKFTFMFSIFIIKITMGNKTHITGVTFNALSDVTIEETINVTLKYSQEGSRWEDYLVLTTSVIIS